MSNQKDVDKAIKDLQDLVRELMSELEHQQRVLDESDKKLAEILEVELPKR